MDTLFLLIQTMMIDHVKRLTEQEGTKTDFLLCFVPQRTRICERVLEEEGVFGSITIADYAMDWIPLEDDVISMELDPGTWKEIYLVCIGSRFKLGKSMG